MSTASPALPRLRLFWQALLWLGLTLALAAPSTRAQAQEASAATTSAVAANAAPAAIPSITQTLQTNSDLPLRSLWQYFYANQTALDPNAVWAMPNSAFQQGDADAVMHLSVGKEYVARFHIQEAHSEFSFYITVPVPHLDEVHLWYRLSGSNEWRAYQAGDIVKQNSWPFIGPYPAFELPGKHQGLDVVMSFTNQTAFPIQAYSQTSKLFHSERNIYSNGTGGSLGLIGAMTLICLLTLRLGRADFFWLALTCLASFFMYIARSGVGYVTFWPEAPHFNDISMYVFASMACAGMTMVVSYLLPNFKGLGITRLAYWIIAALGLALAPMYWLVFNLSSTIILFRLYAIFTLVVCFAAPISMAFIRGDRVSTWASISLLGVIGCFAAQVVSFYEATPIDGWGVVSAVSWMFAAMGLFAAAFGKYQYGHTVLGDQINMKEEVDGLTGLLNAKGFEQSMSLTVLAAGQKRDLSPVITLMMCRLPSIERQEFDSYGKTASNQAEIRLAAAIKHALSETAVVARVQRGCMVIFLAERVTPKIVEASATKIISDVLNAEDLPNFVSDLGLQILIGQVPSHRLSSGVFQALHAYGEAHEYENKTIHWVELSTTTKPVR